MSAAKRKNKRPKSAKHVPSPATRQRAEVLAQRMPLVHFPATARFEEWTTKWGHVLRRPADLKPGRKDRFVVDIVFETELSSTDDTGHLLLRRLKCPKSRYGQALPGPHDYGLDVSTGPVVWPDLAFSNTWAPLRTDKNRAPTFLSRKATDLRFTTLDPS